MNNDLILDRWKSYRGDVSTSPDFTLRVMNAIRADKRGNPFEGMDQWMPSIIGRWSAAAALLMIGLIRIFLMVENLIGAGHVAP